MPTATVEEIHRNSIISVTHDHNPLSEDLPRMQAGGVTSKIFQITVDVDIDAGVAASINRPDQWLHQAVCSMDEALRDIEAHRDACILARTVADIERAKREGKVAILIGTEGTRWLEGQLEPLRIFHRLGLRELQLAWAFPNQVVPDGNLSAFGREVVAECNRLGVIVDLTHLPEAAFDQVVKASRKPVIVSHGSARGVTVDLTDDQLRGLASTGGLIGIHFYVTYLLDNTTVDGVCRQVQYVKSLVGIDHIALGIDFFPRHGAWRKLQEDQKAFDIRWAIEDMSQMPRVTQALFDHGFTETEVKKVLGQNFLRVGREVFGG